MPEPAQKTQRRALQAHASTDGPRSPTHETQNEKPRPNGASPSVSFHESKIRGFQVKRLLRVNALNYFVRYLSLSPHYYWPAPRWLIEIIEPSPAEIQSK